MGGGGEAPAGSVIRRNAFRALTGMAVQSRAEDWTGGPTGQQRMLPGPARVVASQVPARQRAQAYRILTARGGTGRGSFIAMLRSNTPTPVNPAPGVRPFGPLAAAARRRARGRR